MRLFLLSLVFLLFVSNPIARATDVDYDLIKNIAEPTEEKTAKPFSIDLKNRTWVYTGIEEGTKRAKTQLVPGSVTQRIPVELSARYFVDYWEHAGRTPDRIEDGLWPTTKEVLHYRNEPRPLPRESVTAIFSGPPYKRVFSR